MTRPRFVLYAAALGVVAFVAAVVASWPRMSAPEDPRWELILERSTAAQAEIRERERRGAPKGKPLLDAEVELAAEIAKRSDVSAAGRALHALEAELAADPIRTPDGSSPAP